MTKQGVFFKTSGDLRGSYSQNSEERYCVYEGSAIKKNWRTKKFLEMNCFLLLRTGEPENQTGRRLSILTHFLNFQLWIFYLSTQERLKMLRKPCRKLKSFLKEWMIKEKIKLRINPEGPTSNSWRNNGGNARNVIKSRKYCWISRWKGCLAQWIGTKACHHKVSGPTDKENFLKSSEN